MDRENPEMKGFMGDGRRSYIFPAEDGPAADAEDVADGVHACGHHPVIRLPSIHVDTGCRRYIIDY